MIFNEYKLGNGRPRIAVVGCQHGDEPIGLKVIKQLKNIKLKKGTLSLIIANPGAVARRKRFLVKDLNRSFPGKKNGKGEEKIAYYLNNHLKQFDLVIDVHGTNAAHNTFVIINYLNKQMKKLLTFVPIKQIALIRKNIFGGTEINNYTKLGVLLEYGPTKSGKNYRLAVRHIKNILRHFGCLDGKPTLFKAKELFKVQGAYRVPVGFKANARFKDFVLIKKGDVIGRVGKEIIRANSDFYPLFAGNGMYPENKGSSFLTAKKENVIY